MERFRNCIISSEVGSAIRVAEKLLSPESKMIQELESNKASFKYNTPENFIELLLKKKEIINVYTYRPYNIWSKVIGHYSDGKIYLNLRKLPSMGHIDLVGFLLHEYAHYSGLHHGTGPTRNYITKDKLLYSVPYYLSENVAKWI